MNFELVNQSKPWFIQTLLLAGFCRNVGTASANVGTAGAGVISSMDVWGIDSIWISAEAVLRRRATPPARHRPIPLESGRHEPGSRGAAERPTRLEPPSR